MLPIHEDLFVSSLFCSFFFTIIFYYYFTATEVRCQEKTRGGLCYEVILGEPDVKFTPPKRAISPQNKNVSVEDIEEKLRAAEERRQVTSF